uniref:Putative ovule protein n=1 Tax=Solanum chacoense TaxID=4108 RepID=A0A0V0IBR2_SOLCH
MMSSYYGLFPFVILWPTGRMILVVRLLIMNLYIQHLMHVNCLTQLLKDVQVTLHSCMKGCVLVELKLEYYDAVVLKISTLIQVTSFIFHGITC